MASDAWNRGSIPFPAIQRAVAVPRADITGELFVAINKGCHSVQVLLNSKTLDTEVRILPAILYIFHNRLGYHKTYLALKQIQQCLKRLTAMNLEGAVQDMLELCGRKPELQQGAQISVPSQPVLELVCLKILGGCKLLLRLLDCCCKTFHLSVQHLHLEEFIVLNLVIAGLVSRLWVMHQCILKRLASFYGPLFGLLQEVSRVHQMPYIHGFIFPSQIATFLGPAFSETKKKLPLTHSQRGATGLLSKLFSEQALSSVPAAAGIRAPLRKRKAPQMRLPGTRASDVGQPVLQSRRDKGTLPEFDVKTLRKRLKTSFCKDITSRIKCRDPKNSSRRSGAILSEQEKRSDRAVLLVLKIQMVQSFQELSEELRKVVVSCRSQRWTSEATFLGNTFLKCNRLKYVEALGYSLKRKLRCVKASIRKCLLHGQPRFYQRAGHPRIRSFLKASQKKKSKRRREKSRDGISLHSEAHCFQQFCADVSQRTDDAYLRRSSQPLEPSNQNLNVDCFTAKLPIQRNVVEVSGILGSKRAAGAKADMDEDEIDDIFASMGV